MSNRSSNNFNQNTNTENSIIPFSLKNTNLFELMSYHHDKNKDKKDQTVKKLSKLTKNKNKNCRSIRKS